jgi:hypothetical protein
VLSRRRRWSELDRAIEIFHADRGNHSTTEQMFCDSTTRVV